MISVQLLASTTLVNETRMSSPVPLPVGLGIGVGSLFLRKSVWRWLVLGARLSVRFMVLGVAYIRYQTIEVASRYVERHRLPR